MIFDQRLISIMRETEYCLYHYGSSCTKLDSARDIDIVAVSSEYKAPMLKQFRDQVVSPPFNFFMVPEAVFIQDVTDLSYGGFFAHKFSLNYRLITRTASSCDAPFLFWASEARAYSDINGRVPSPDVLILWTHFSILTFNPTFGRSLTRFIQDNEARENLLNCVGAILERLSTEDFPRLTLSRDWRELFYRFLSTYQTIKNGGILWGKNTLTKVTTSCLEYDEKLINDYFGDYDLTSAFSGRASARR